MTALVVLELVAIVILMVLVAGLLRSHADILRALYRLGIDLDGSRRSDGGDVPSGGGTGGRAPVGAGALTTGDGRAAADLVGQSPSDEALHIPVASVRHDTLLAFLTSGCSTCLAFWQALARPDLAVPGGARVVVVVHDPAEESISRIRSLAPAGSRVVMSSPAWEDYGVAYAPYFVYVSGREGRVVGEGVAGTWPELVSLLDQALADARATGSATAGGRPAVKGADRIDRDLRAAGIVPGDARLYPARLDQTPSSDGTLAPGSGAAPRSGAASSGPPDR